MSDEVHEVCFVQSTLLQIDAKVQRFKYQFHSLSASGGLSFFIEPVAESEKLCFIGPEFLLLQPSGEIEHLRFHFPHFGRCFRKQENWIALSGTEHHFGVTVEKVCKICYINCRHS